MTEDQVMAGAKWLSENSGTSARKWSDCSVSRQADLLRWTRGILTAAEAAGRHVAPAAPPRAPLDPDAMWKALVEASTS